ncbi:MAG: glycogen/starch/alpha-glucan phosphorylase [Acidobacteria bacterium]|nr:MAG: glycogen/starch/alpha-glucan phosphorylase [Acidobacteriota bacterium]
MERKQVLPKLEYLPGGVSASSVADSIRRHVKYSLAEPWRDLSSNELLTAVALSVRDLLTERMLETEEYFRAGDFKSLSYISIEFLIGQSLSNHLHNLRIFELYRQACANLGIDLDSVEEAEGDAALGNGGLGRLAACFLDSLATLGMPAYGYGINYEYGLFKQEIDNGYQQEKPENWAAEGSPWEIGRPEAACLVPIYGHIEHALDRDGGYNPMWMGWKILIGVPYDMLISGYGGRVANILRLYSARSSMDFDMRIFNDGDYFKAVEQKIASETISKVLYPSDAVVAGRELRLVQEYFLAACAVRDTVQRFERNHNNFREFPEKIAIQLNDTHPALAVVELMRILVDEKALEWSDAWEITQATFGFTNHTLVPEALEQWPVPLLQYVIPRHLQIIYEINGRFLEHISTVCPGDPALLKRVSLIEESKPQQVRMTNLAMVGSHSINGVSAIHTGLIKTSLAPDLYKLCPEKFNNKTNGITPRRWLLKANPGLASLVTATIGDNWITDLAQLRKLEDHVGDTTFRAEFRKTKASNKVELARIIQDNVRVKVDPDSLFDVQVKRIHSYKRQLLNVLHITDQYLALIEDGRKPVVPRTHIFAGKAAPGYWKAKQVIKLIHEVARVINNDSRAQEWIKVVFLPDYRVSLAERIFPAVDLGEQISTAGMEASGTSNMKMTLNGAITIGTLDGANIEIRDEVGEENIFIFGHEAHELLDMRIRHTYQPRAYYDRDPRIKRIVDAFGSDLFSPRESGLFQWIYDDLLDENDEYFHLADLPSYLEAQEKASAAYCDPDRWTSMSLLNVSRVGRFSSDRVIAEYAREIWNLKAV